MLNKDINYKYVQFVKRVSSKAGLTNSLYNVLRFGAHSILSLLIPILLLYGALLIVFLKVKMFFSNNTPTSKLHRDAIQYIPKFIRQYPMHLYPVVAKSLELAFLKSAIYQIKEPRGSVAELAIGEGTLSSHIFAKHDPIYGFDLNPYSLVHTRNYSHLVDRVVADCTNPPIADHGANLIVSNNFLHHIEDKDSTLNKWAHIAPYAIFNENTPYWASSWAKPYLLKLMGLSRMAEKSAEKIETLSAQSLCNHDKLNSLVTKYYKIEQEVSYFSEKTFFLSAVCSTWLFSYGPPTPFVQKFILNTVLWPLTYLLTYLGAKALIEYDAILPREKDVFIHWLVKSKLANDHEIKEIVLVCPDCRFPLRENWCGKCQQTFYRKDGMLFLLPRELEHDIQYVRENSENLGKEHL